MLGAIAFPRQIGDRLPFLRSLLHSQQLSTSRINFLVEFRNSGLE